MQIPSWAFASVGKSLFGYKSEPDLVIVQMPEPLDMSLDISLDILVEPLDMSQEPLDISLDMSLDILPVQPDILVEPVIYESTIYDEFIELIIKNSLIQILIELYT